MDKRTVRFIINPISGIGKQKTVEKLIPQILNHDLFEYEIKYTTGRGDARKFSLEAVADSIDILAAVGGDGTVSEIVSGLVNSNVELAIIPAGSGNGLARGLQIPIATKKAIKTINNNDIVKIDTGEINGKVFANVAGVGFDAHISKHFYSLGVRGMKNYIRLSAREFFKYKSREYLLEVDGTKRKLTAWVISFANSRQYGNNALIAPNAVVNDKLLDVVIVKPFSIFMVPVLLYRLFKGTFDKSSYSETFKAAEIILNLEKDGTIHLDGDPHKLGRSLHVKVLPQSVKVIVPKR